jgi:hypothetical protein
MVTVTARVDMMARTVGCAMVSEGRPGEAFSRNHRRPGWDMDGPRGQELDRAWSFCVPALLPLSAGGRPFLRVWRDLRAGLEGRIEWPIAGMLCGTVSPGRPVSRSAEVFLLVMCIRRAGVPDGSA